MDGEILSPTERKPWQFKPGQSGNPGGRTALPPELRAKLESYAPDVIERLGELALHSTDERVALAASEIIMSRLYGKPAQAVDATIKTGTIQEAHLKALNELRERRLAGIAANATTNATAETVVATIITPGEDQ